MTRKEVILKFSLEKFSDFAQLATSALFEIVLKTLATRANQNEESFN